MESSRSASPPTTVDSLLASLKMDSRIQALQFKAISLQHSLRKMTARPDLKAATSQPVLPPVVAPAPPPSPTPVVRSSLLDEQDVNEDDLDGSDSDSDAYYSVYDGYDIDEEDIQIETALPSPITQLCNVRYMTVTRVTTGPRLVHISKTPDLTPCSSAASSPSRSSSASSLPQARSSTSSYGSWTSMSTAGRTSISNPADWNLDSIKPSSPGGAPVTSRIRVRNLADDERQAKHARRRSLIGIYFENLGRS